MPNARREFLATIIESIGGASIICQLGCSSSKQTRASHDVDTIWAANVAHIEERIPHLMTELHVPGVSIALIRDARIAWRMGFGVKDQISRAPVHDDTVFEAQSMSKPVFAYRVIKLAEQGVLNLDAPLTEYTPDVFVPGDPRLKLITARRVLSHTSGLPNWRSKETPLRINFTPGEKWSYSGEGYHYLQSAVTRLVGHVDPKTCGTYELGYRVCASDFGEYMKANLLVPFGMTSSGYVWTEATGKKLARAHDANGRPLPARKSTAVDVARYGSAGSLLTTATDYANFMVEVMNPKPADAYRLNEASRKEMLRPQVSVPNVSPKMSWALGWQIWHLNKGDIVAHGGDFKGFHSEAAMSVLRKTGFVIMTNGENGTELIWKRLIKDFVDWFL
jgi:CubicO group peptidase (beta-lactamase class C family)